MDEGKSDVWTHLKRGDGQGRNQTLRDLLPELFPEGRGYNKYLFGCPECDVMLQVSSYIAYAISADN